MVLDVNPAPIQELVALGATAATSVSTSMPVRDVANVKSPCRTTDTETAPLVPEGAKSSAC